MIDVYDIYFAVLILVLPFLLIAEQYGFWRRWWNSFSKMSEAERKVPQARETRTRIEKGKLSFP